MGIDKEEVKYYATNFRTRKSYLAFQIFQIVLSLIIIVSALTSPIHFRQSSVLYMEFLLLMCMSFDLYAFPQIVSPFGGFPRARSATPSSTKSTVQFWLCSS